MNTSASVGFANAKTQFSGTWHRDYVAGGATLIRTAAQIVADAIATAAQVRKSDGSTRALAVTDFIASIDVDLKPVGGQGNAIAVQVSATTANASLTDGGAVYNIDAGGSGQVGALRDENDFYLRTGFQQIEIAAGSIVVVSVVFASIPA